MSEHNSPARAVHVDKPIKLELSIEAVDVPALIQALNESAEFLADRSQGTIFFPLASVWVSPSQKGHLAVFDRSQPEDGGA